jgi:hypothetical protein
MYLGELPHIATFRIEPRVNKYNKVVSQSSP